MTYRLETDGDYLEKFAWPNFLQSEFPSYEMFWQKHVVPLTNRPIDIHFKSDAELAKDGKNAEDIAIGQLHYTILKHLCLAYQQRLVKSVNEFTIFIGLMSLCGAQDVAFELLERSNNRGYYHPWLEESIKGDPPSGQDAQREWKKANQYPLQDIRNYRNKLIHGRILPTIKDYNNTYLPAPHVVDKYCDWRNVTNPTKVLLIPKGDFLTAKSIIDVAWKQTINYLDTMWKIHLLS
jgi:hypothetical protein